MVRGAPPSPVYQVVSSHLDPEETQLSKLRRLHKNIAANIALLDFGAVSLYWPIVNNLLTNRPSNEPKLDTEHVDLEVLEYEFDRDQHIDRFHRYRVKHLVHLLQESPHMDVAPPRLVEDYIAHALPLVPRLGYGCICDVYAGDDMME